MKNFKRSIKLFLFIPVLLLIGTLKVEAQKGAFGLRYMPTFSSTEIRTSSGGSVQGEAEMGFGAGALLAFNFSEYIGIQGELIYSSTSQKYRENDFDRKINLKYVNIPLLLSLNTGKLKKVNFNVVAGPQIGLSVGSSFTGGPADDEAVLSVKKGDLGFAYGAGIDFALTPSGTFRLGLGYRGVRGMFDISDNNRTLTGDGYYLLDRSKNKSNAGYVGLSFLF